MNRDEDPKQIHPSVFKYCPETGLTDEPRWLNKDRNQEGPELAKDYPARGATPGIAPSASYSLMVQDDSTFVILDSDGEGVGEQTDKALCIVSAKVAADAHGP